MRQLYDSGLDGEALRIRGLAGGTPVLTARVTPSAIWPIGAEKPPDPEEVPEQTPHHIRDRLYFNAHDPGGVMGNTAKRKGGRDTQNGRIVRSERAQFRGAQSRWPSFANRLSCIAFRASKSALSLRMMSLRGISPSSRASFRAGVFS